MRSLLPLALLTATPATAEVAPYPAIPDAVMPDGGALTESIRDADSALFDLFFNGCDPEKLRDMVSDTLEFYHDKGGLVASSGAQFVADHGKSCEARKAPTAWRSRRELIPNSLRVDPVPGFGAMEVGEHYFYERQGDGPETRVGRAGFAMVWAWDRGTWRLHRVLSFGHVSAPEAP